MRILLALTLALSIAPLTAEAQGDRPLRPPEADRYVGADTPSWQVTQALGALTEPISLDGTGMPICVGWGAIVAVSADARTCWCWSQTVSATVAAPTGNGGCRMSEDNGPDGAGSCWSTAAAETKWKWPHRPVVEARAGARLGMCTTLTSSTAGLGREVALPCRTTAECTARLGSGTCDTVTTGAEREAASCAFLLSRAAEATTAYVEGGR